MSSPRGRRTTYCGITMRSRLEAAYAQALDVAGIAWAYEPRCFADASGQYLPDFLVDDPTRYVEVKPTKAQAIAAAPRMERILSSEPDAWLEVVHPVGTWPDITFVAVARWAGAFDWTFGHWPMPGPTQIDRVRHDQLAQSAARLAAKATRTGDPHDIERAERARAAADLRTTAP